MRYSILFVVVLVLVSGFIAYFGDVLGRWMGKKRLTLWHMRPRNTAYIVTAITGMLISGLAVIAFVSVSTEFRKVFTQGERIFSQNKRLSAANITLGHTNTSLAKRRKELEAKVAKQQKEVDQAVEAMVKAADAQVKAVAAVTRLEKDIARRKRELEAGKRELSALKKSSTATKRELDAKTAQIREAGRQLVREQENLMSAQARYASAATRLDETNTKLKEAQKLRDEQEKLVAEQDAYIREQQALLVKLGNEKEKFRQRASEYEQLLATADFRFRQGDEVARGTVSLRQSRFTVRRDLYSILDVASDNAKARGAVAGANDRAVVVSYPANGTERERVELVIDAAAIGAIQSYDALIQVICEENTVVGEQVPVRLVLYHNKLVYRKGDLIATTEMNGRLSEGRVLLSVIEFLQDEISRAGLKAGIVPVSNPDPRASLGANPQKQVEGLMSVVDQIKSKNTRVKVEAFACADVYAADPLNMSNMRFSVTKE